MPRFRLITLLLLSLSLCAHAAVPIPKAPALDARSYVLIDHDTGRVLAADKADLEQVVARSMG